MWIPFLLQIPELAQILRSVPRVWTLVTVRKVGVGCKGTETACLLVLGSSSLGEVINGFVKGCIVACIIALDLSVVLLALFQG